MLKYFLLLICAAGLLRYASSQCSSYLNDFSYVDADPSTKPVSLKLTVQDDYFTGMKYMGVNAGHSYPTSNWLKFVKRFGVNAYRIFVTMIYNLRTFIGTSRWGQDLNGAQVNNREAFQTAINQLRSPAGHNISQSWTNPVKWSSIFDNFAKFREDDVTGNLTFTLSKLNELGIEPLLVLQIGCEGPGTYFEFSTMADSESYWAERWELYKYSYANAVWSWSKKVSMIEFYNEPDLSLGKCLTPDQYVDYLLIRALSIKNAYSDLNQENPNESVQLNLMGPALARGTYGGDSQRYLGDITIKYNRVVFDSMVDSSSWLNLDTYTAHTYDKTGSDVAKLVAYLRQSLANDSSSIPVVLTEHNTHTDSNFENSNTTCDTNTEASRLASQLINLVASNVSADYIFKFSATIKSRSTPNRVKKNGLHWAEVYEKPYDLSDSSLAAEAARLLTALKSSKVFTVANSPSSGLRTFLGSLAEIDTFYHLYIVNDGKNQLNISIDLSKWTNIVPGARVFVDTVSLDFFSEISSIQTIGTNMSNALSIFIDAYSTNRVAIPRESQSISSITSQISCTLNAGSLSSISNCNNQVLKVGTSNSNQHESTSVAVIGFQLNQTKPIKRALLQLNIEGIEGSAEKMTVMVLGLNKFDQKSNLSWSSVSTGESNEDLLIPLASSSNSSIVSISQNYVNWTSKSDLEIVGHLSGKSLIKQKRFIDVTEYVKSDGAQKTFLLWRPFRHPAYNDSIVADDLDNGSVMKISSAQSADCQNRPELIIYF